MSEVFKAVSTFFSFAVLAVAAQNVIFTRGLGLSQGLRIINDPKKDTLYFCVSLTVFQITTSLLVYAVIPVFNQSKFAQYKTFAMPAIVVLCCMISYIVVITCLNSFLNRDQFKNIVYSVTSASINSAIVGTIVICTSQGFTLIETLGYGVGSSLGYFLAMLLVVEGERKIRHDLIPESFKGLPVTLIYISVLALAIYGLTGHTLAL